MVLKVRGELRELKVLLVHRVRVHKVIKVLKEPLVMVVDKVLKGLREHQVLQDLRVVRVLKDHLVIQEPHLVHKGLKALKVLCLMELKERQVTLVTSVAVSLT